MGYTHALPPADAAPGQPVRIGDLWGLCESQETVGVGPDQFEEFIFPYQQAAIERFGRAYYGCCEPVNTRWHVIRRLKNLKRVSVSPWCDERFMGEALCAGYVYSRKPNPTLISTATFDEAAIRADLRATLQAAKGCALEIIMKDVHTLNNQPDRPATTAAEPHWPSPQQREYWMKEKVSSYAASVWQQGTDTASLLTEQDGIRAVTQRGDRRK